MTDIHSHFIPFVDDGSPSLEKSIEMLKQEIPDGVDKIICTPHHVWRRYEATAEEIKAGFDALQAEAKKQNLPVQLFLGQEICFNRSEDILGMLKQGKLLTMSGTNNVLVEFDPILPEKEIPDIVFDFSVNGYDVILAHVERYPWMNLETVFAAKSEGAKIQINAGSLLGDFGSQAQKLCEQLLKKGLVDYVANDTHSFRPCVMGKAYKKVKDHSLFEGTDLV